MSFNKVQDRVRMSKQNARGLESKVFVEMPHLAFMAIILRAGYRRTMKKVAAQQMQLPRKGMQKLAIRPSSIISFPFFADRVINLIILTVEIFESAILGLWAIFVNKIDCDEIERGEGRGWGKANVRGRAS